ncbi:TetR/AcrR family transcriptional regulator [Mycobacterium shigaense]|uniref:TetR/AcrR family transcriptional regulator n=1 Tax=Mycobacterium shigaense TaxID=722731 RepID=UPI000D45C495|nr:TetR/AcrR family transcriptional regulator [Mycobacterium shigaense]MEA1121556.1 TetR/AcrR family transcriptional regulator [Mycobacterium shigaense]PRI15161.1 hypothetical protein B2J96_12130 [Mycobacterium shigaense]
MGRPSVKDQLVERTLGVWLARGFEGASVNDLVTAASVPKGSFYNHFPSKEDFAIAHVDRYVGTLDLDGLADAELSGLTAVRRHFERLVARRDPADLSGCLLSTFSTGISPEYAGLIAAVRAGFDQWTDALTGALSRARDSGEIPSDRDPAEVAAALVDAFQGALARARVYGHSGPLDLFFVTALGALTGAS